MRRTIGAPAIALLALASALGASAPGSSIPGASTPGASTPGASTPQSTGAVSRLTLRVLATRPHAVDAFTEGLLFADRARVYESSGLYGRSDVREVKLATGAVLRRRLLDPTDFGEGLASVGGHLVQLTYREHHAWSWSTPRLVRSPAFGYTGEGWGLAYDRRRRMLVMSDGTATLTWRDPRSGRADRTVTVRRDGRPVSGINELEVVSGAVWANVFPTDEILRIDASSGRVTGVLDAASLRAAVSAAKGLGPNDVLNGIAHRPGEPDTVLWLTGKRWPTMFQVRVRSS